MPATSFQSLASIAGGLARPSRSGSPHITGRPIHRSSKEEGSFEHQYFRAPGKGETDRILHAARRALDAGRRLKTSVRTKGATLSASERLIARLTAGAVRVLEEILTFARLNAGKVFPSYDRLAAGTGLGRRTIARAVVLLEEVGLLDHQRRFKRVADDGDRKAYRQTSNAYRTFLPDIIRRYLPKSLRPIPIPADAAHRRREDATETARMLKDATCEQHVAFTAGTDSPLARQLRSLARLVDERECQIGTAPLPNIL